MEEYDDIIDLPHHVSENHRPMPIENRAAQFAPFAALTGHDDAIAETARLTDQLPELSEFALNELSGKLSYALQNDCKIRVRYFSQDSKKSGGSYIVAEGKIKKYDEYSDSLKMENNTEIPLKFITNIDIKDLSIV